MSIGYSKGSNKQIAWNSLINHRGLKLDGAIGDYAEPL